MLLRGCASAPATVRGRLQRTRMLDVLLLSNLHTQSPGTTFVSRSLSTVLTMPPAPARAAPQRPLCLASFGCAATTCVLPTNFLPSNRHTRARRTIGGRSDTPAAAASAPAPPARTSQRGTFLALRSVR